MAQRLSEHLGSEALYVGNGDTSGVVFYEAFASGERVEGFYSGETWDGLKAQDFQVFEKEAGGTVTAFFSARRTVGLPKLQTHGRFVDAFLVDRGAYAPGPLGEIPPGRPRPFEPGGLPAAAFERVDVLLTGKG